jgi:hypothetical protein
MASTSLSSLEIEGKLSLFRDKLVRTSDWSKCCKMFDVSWRYKMIMQEFHSVLLCSYTPL